MGRDAAEKPRPTARDIEHPKDIPCILLHRNKQKKVPGQEGKTEQWIGGRCGSKGPLTRKQILVGSCMGWKRDLHVRASLVTAKKRTGATLSEWAVGFPARLTLREDWCVPWGIKLHSVAFFLFLHSLPCHTTLPRLIPT